MVGTWVVGTWVVGSGFEVYFEGIDEGEEPGEEFLVDGVAVVGVEGGAGLELHDSSELVALRSRRDVDADEGFNEAGDLALKGADLADDMLLLILGDGGLPPEGEGVDDHAEIVK